MANIYALKCQINGMAYIGCTKGNLSKRWREHKCLLNKGRHSVKTLLSDWQNYGQVAFGIESLETFPSIADVDFRRAREKYWMTKFHEQGLLYNTDMRSFELTMEQIRKGVEASRKVPKYFSPEALMRKRMSQLGIPKGHGAKISATKRANRLKRDEIVSSASKVAGASDKEPRTTA